MDLMPEILDELIVELGIEESDADIKILKVKLKNAIREVKTAVGYNERHTAEFIENDIQNYIGNIKMLAMYDFGISGAEGQKTHNEKNIGRTWTSRSECFRGITRFAETS